MNRYEVRYQTYEQYEANTWTIENYNTWTEVIEYAWLLRDDPDIVNLEVSETRIVIFKSA